MIHQFRDKKKIERNKRITHNVMIVVFFVLLSTLGIISWFGGFLNFIGKPIWKAQNVITNTMTDTSYVVRTKASVFNENESLKQENTNLKNKMIDYEVLVKENDQLKELMGRLPAKNSFTISNILAKPNRSPYDTLIVDVGTDSNILNGEEVFASEIPIGMISKVYAHTALVSLYSNPGQTTEAIINGSNATVELLGRGGGNFEMTIPNDLASDKGTLVLVPGNEHSVVAVIDAVISDPRDPEKKVILHSPVNIQELKWVEIKKN